jgi:hypothetical protein
LLFLRFRPTKDLVRLWTLHPEYLDPAGLVAAWREALLAQKVLLGHTRGYRNHPQLARFQQQPHPELAIAAFLRGLADEADQRGYRFDRTKILHDDPVKPFAETRGQLLYEWEHLRTKLKARDPRPYREFCKLDMPRPHPLFRIVAGSVRPWEKIPS